MSLGQPRPTRGDEPFQKVSQVTAWDKDLSAGTEGGGESVTALRSAHGLGMSGFHFAPHALDRLEGCT